MTTDSSSANRLIEIGIALSAEKDTTVLMERILLEDQIDEVDIEEYRAA